MSTNATGAVRIDRPREGVLRITLSRPERLNAMSAAMVQGLHDALATADAEAGCRVVVLTGSGRAFCAGLDLDGYGTPPGPAGPGAVQQGLAVQRHIATLVQRIRRLRQPVVVGVNGPAAGGGLALVCASDVRLASSTAIFAASFIRVGFSGCDIGTSWLLPRLVGAGRAHELMLTGRRVDAEEALRIGLVADVVPPEGLPARVDATVEAVLKAPPLSIELTKQGMWLALETPSFDATVELENRQQVLTMLTQDQPEAMRAWVERRPPAYEDR